VIAHTSIAQHALLGIVGVLAVAAYAALWGRHRRASIVEPVMWAVGIAVALLATAPPLERAADRSFTWHMAQHLVLGLVATPFLVLARPGHLLAEALPSLRRHGRVLRLGQAGPIAAAAVAVVLMFVVHAGPVYDLALRHRTAHDVQHVLFAVSGALFWAGALGPRARQGPSRLIAALTAATGLTLLSVWILMLDAPLSDVYVARRGFASALDDQRMGAGLMWVGMIALTMPLLMLAVWRWAAAEQRQAERLEQLVSGRLATGARHGCAEPGTDAFGQRASRS
jgi:cytochrome c oxidase assembly factor CtaG